jgi:plasmid stabilization system protein ParE
MALLRRSPCGSQRIAYLIVDETRIEVLGVFHGSMDIERHLR